MVSESSELGGGLVGGAVDTRTRTRTQTQTRSDAKQTQNTQNPLWRSTPTQPTWKMRSREAQVQATDR